MTNIYTPDGVYVVLHIVYNRDYHGFVLVIYEKVWFMCTVNP
jgi:hypothetical protein